MKTLVLLRRIATTLLLAVPLLASAQEQSVIKSANFNEGDQTLAVGFGLGVRYGYPDHTTMSPAIALIYDVGVADGLGPGTLGFGAIMGFKNARVARRDPSSGNEFSARWNNFIVGARGSYHFTLGEGFENLDLYGGIMTGVRFQHFRNRTVSGNALAHVIDEHERFEIRPTVGFFGGGRYDFTPEIGAWLEVGYDISLIKAGVHFNF